MTRLLPYPRQDSEPVAGPVVAAGGASPAALAALVAAAEACNLPADFVAALSPE